MTFRTGMSVSLLKALWVYFLCYDKAEVDVKFDWCGNDNVDLWGSLMIRKEGKYLLTES